MKQINNGFAECYYLTDTGEVYNNDTGKLLLPDNKHSVKLKTTDGRYKKVSIKTLYKAVYNRAFAIDKIQSLDNEVWKEVDSKGNYYVSNKGRVKSYTGYEARLLNPYVNKSGYLRLDIIDDGIRQSKLLHRIVAAAFLPPPAKIDYQLHHKDFDKRNNAADNLEWLCIAEHLKKHRERGQAEADGYSRKPENDNNE